MTKYRCPLCLRTYKESEVPPPGREYCGYVGAYEKVDEVPPTQPSPSFTWPYQTPESKL